MIRDTRQRNNLRQHLNPNQVLWKEKYKGIGKLGFELVTNNMNIVRSRESSSYGEQKLKIPQSVKEIEYGKCEGDNLP